MYPLSIVLFECASSMEVLMSDHIHKDPLQHCELEIEKFLLFYCLQRLKILLLNS